MRPPLPFPRHKNKLIHPKLCRGGSLLGQGQVLRRGSGREGGSDPVPQQFLHLQRADSAEPAEPPWLRVYSPKSKLSCKSSSRETKEPLTLREGSSSFQRSPAFPALSAAQLHSQLSCSHIPAPLEHLFSSPYCWPCFETQGTL